MTNNEFKILRRYRNRKAIERHDVIIIENLGRMKLISVDFLYFNKIDDVTINYAKTTELGISLLRDRNRFKNIPFLNLFFK